MTVVSIFHNRPDFIPIQLESIRRYFVGKEISYVVANNARDWQMRREISAVCRSLGIRCFPVKRDLLLELKIRREYKEKVFVKGSKYRNVNIACSYAFMYLWKNLLDKLNSQNVCFLDSDMFFMKEFDPSKLVFSEVGKVGSIAFVPIIRSSKIAKLDIYHPWNGLFLANSGSIGPLRSLVWHPGQIFGEKLDVGGQAHHWLENNRESINYIHLTSFSLYYLRKEDDKLKGRVTVNGSFLAEFIVLSLLPLKIDFIIAGPDAPYETLDFSYLDNIFGKGNGKQYLLNGIARLIEVEKHFDAPDPKYFDLIGVFDNGNFQELVFHYKSVSNYQEWSSDEYNEKKTLALKNLFSR